MATVESVDFSAQSYANQQAITSYTGTNFTVAFDKGSNSNAPKYYNSGTAIRCYGSNTITFTSKTSEAISKIVITFGDSDGTNAISANVGSFSTDTWTGSASSVVLTIGGSSGNRRIKAVEVTLTAPVAVAQPIISGNEKFFDETQVTITCETTGASIYYTLDGSDPTAESAAYTDEFTLTETKTVKAIAIKGDESSEISSKVFTKNPSFASFEALIAAELAEHTPVEVSFSNIVIDSIYLNGSQKRHGIYFAVNGVAYEIYCNKAEIPAEWEAGDKVSGTIRGDWYSYNDLWEIVPSASDWTWEELTRTADTRMAGAYNIGGENADFAKLSDAIIALEANGMSADVDLVICADLAENVNVGITNNTDHILTIRPDAAIKRTITYGSQADNKGPSGHILIGATMAKDFNTTIATKNVVIDGSIDGEGQYLEFRAGSAGGRVIVFYGAVTNSVVRNCRVINPRTSGTNYAFEIRTESSTNNHPDGVIIENNYAETLGSANVQCIVFNGSGATSAAGYPLNTIIRNNEIVSNLRGIFFNKATNATIEGNTFRMPNTSAGFLAHAIMGNAQGGTIIVRGNKFIENGCANASAGAYGLQTITASGGSDVWVIENNYFAGMDSKGATENKSVVLTYIRCGDSCVVRHNTFYMPSLTHKPGTEQVAAQAVSCVWLAGATVKYPVENNIIISAETVAKNSLIRGALNENVKNNVFFHNGGEAAILAGAVVAADSAAFFAEGANAGSKWTNPVFVDAAIGDLRIKVANNDLKMPLIEDVDKDITGASRYTMTYAGAFEYDPDVTTAVEDVMELNVEGIQKIFRNGQVLIIKDGKTYNMMGQIVE